MRANSFLAWLRYRERRYADGLALMEPVLSKEPSTYNYWIAGTLAAGAGDTLRALRYASQIASHFGGAGQDSEAAEAYGDRRFYYHVRGLVELSAHRPASAVHVFEQALRYTSRADAPFFRTYLGRALIEAGELGRAEQELRRVLEFNPNDPEAQLLLGSTLAQAGNWAEARPVLRRLKSLWKDADADDPLNVELARLLAASTSKP